MSSVLSAPLFVLVGIALGVVVLTAAVSMGVRRVRRRRPGGAGVPDGPAEPSPWQEPATGPSGPARPGPASALPAPALPSPAASTPTVAAAVARALAAREARGGDARDRLLAVLLEDPVRAVGATVELDACCRQLDRLADAVAHERTALRGVLTRLTATGLSDGQLARLAGLHPDELRALLPGRVGLTGDAVQPRG